MIVNRKTLLTALKAVSPAVGARDNNMQQDCFIFHGGCVLAYNDEVAIHHHLPDSMEGLPDMAVPAKELLALLNKTSVEEVTLECNEDCLTVLMGRGKGRFKVQTDFRMPLDELCDWSATAAQKLPNGFCEALASVLQSCGKDMTRPLTTCVYFHENMLLASDSYQCARHQFKKFKWLDDVYLPKASAELVSKLSGLTTYGLRDGWIHFFEENENAVVVCRTYYKGQPFADVRPLFEEKGSKLNLPEILPDMLERAGIFTSRDDTDAGKDVAEVWLDIQAKRVTVRGEGALGDYEENAKIQYDGVPLTVKVKVPLLVRVIKESLDCELCKNFVHIKDAQLDYLLSYAGKA